MSDNLKSKDSEFLTQLSDKEQENVTGGFDIGNLGFFFFQQTDIESFADRQTDISAGKGVSGSSSSRAGYRFSQTTLAFGSFFGFGRGRRRNRQFSPLIGFFNIFHDWTG